MNIQNKENSGISVVNANNELLFFPWKKVLLGKLDKLENHELVQITTLAHFVDKVLGSRLSSLKTEIKERMPDMGKRHTDSTMRWEDDANGTVDVMKRSKPYIDEAELKLILSEKGIAEEEVFVPITTVELDEKKLERLVASGALGDDDIRRFSQVKTSDSVVVRKYAYGIQPKEFIKSLETS